MLILTGVLIHQQHSVVTTLNTIEITSITTFLSRPSFINFTICLIFLISKYHELTQTIIVSLLLVLYMCSYGGLHVMQGHAA
jgi:predicted NACHT family NTPase